MLSQFYLHTPHLSANRMDHTCTGVTRYIVVLFSSVCYSQCLYVDVNLSVKMSLNLKLFVSLKYYLQLEANVAVQPDEQYYYVITSVFANYWLSIDDE